MPAEIMDAVTDIAEIIERLVLQNVITPAENYRQALYLKRLCEDICEFGAGNPGKILRA